MPGAVVVGCGGGGSNTVSQMRAQYDLPSLTINNSDADIILGMPKVQTTYNVLPTSHSFRGYNGAAYSATLARRDEIERRITGFDTVVAVATLGGGAGFGTMWAMSQICRSLGIVLAAVVVLPFRFEEEHSTDAERGLPKTEAFADLTVILDMEKLSHMGDGLKARAVIGASDLLLSKALRTVADLSSRFPLKSVFAEDTYTFSYGFEPTLAESALAAVRQPMYETDPIGKSVVVVSDSEVTSDQLEDATSAVAGFTGAIPETIQGKGPGKPGATVFIPVSVPDGSSRRRPRRRP